MQLALNQIEATPSHDTQSKYGISSYNSPVKHHLFDKTPNVSNIKPTYTPSGDASAYWQETPETRVITPIAFGKAIDRTSEKPLNPTFDKSPMDKSPMNMSPINGIYNRKSASPLCVSRLIETDRQALQDPPPNYDPEKLYFKDPEIKAIAESSRKFRSLTWKEPHKQTEYFKVLRESNILDYKFYGHPEEVLELKLSQITGIPPQNVPNRHSDITQYSTINDVKRELAQSNYMTRIRNSTYIDNSQSGLKKSYGGTPRRLDGSNILPNRFSNVIDRQKAENLMKSGSQTDRSNP